MPKSAKKNNVLPAKPDAAAQFLLDRQQRVERARAEIIKICQKERVDVVATGFDIVNGQIRGRVNIVAIDNV